MTYPKKVFTWIIPSGIKRELAQELLKYGGDGCPICKNHIIKVDIVETTVRESTLIIDSLDRLVDEDNYLENDSWEIERIYCSECGWEWNGGTTR